MKVLVCDDHETRAKEICEEIAALGLAIEARPVWGDELESSLAVLFGRVNSCVKNASTYAEEGDVVFDNFDIVAIDNNLAGLKQPVRITAEVISGYVRTFAKTAYVVSLNKTPDVDFDLRYLIGDFTTKADFAVNARPHMGNLSLWEGRMKEAVSQFSPWYWPRLLSVADQRRRQIEFVRAHLEKKVKTALQLERLWDHLSPHARGALCPASDNGNEPTFRDVFLHSERSIAGDEDRSKIANGTCNAATASVVARAVAGDVDRWFRRDILAPQDALIDVPHLLMRFPMLLGDGAKELERWNAAVVAKKAPYGLDGALYGRFLAKPLYSVAEWTSSPLFDWEALRNDEGLKAEFLKADSGGWPEAVFCEDTSRFVVRDAGPTEFSAEFEGSWTKRFVELLHGDNAPKYGPRSRLGV